MYVSVDGGASWTVQTSLPPNGTWTSVASSADGSRLAAVDLNGSVWTFYNGTWTAQAGLGEQPWSAVEMSGDGSTIIVGVAGQYIRSLEVVMKWGYWTWLVQGLRG